MFLVVFIVKCSTSFFCVPANPCIVGDFKSWEKKRPGAVKPEWLDYGIMRPPPQPLCLRGR